MLNPFLLTAVFYLVVAVIIALDAALTSLSLIPWFVGLPWLRVHFIALGMLTQTVFGVAPALVAGRRGAEAPATRWDIWLLLNAGLVLLLAGAPSVNGALIVAGGVLVFAAVLLLILHLRAIAGPAAGSGSLKFYLAGLIFLLVGVLIGAGLWVGWSAPLRIAAPKEAHIHANVWGFAGLFFAGLLVDLLPALTGRPLAGRRSVDAIFGALALGALLLLLAPWLGIGRPLLAPGMAALLLGVAALIVALARQLGRAGLFAQAGAWHLVLAYGWILLPAAATPLLLLSATTLPMAEVELTAPQTLIYGWIAQFLYAVIPYGAARWLLRDPAARLGGNWLSLAAVNLGAALIWASILLADVRGLLNGAGYLLLGVSLAAAAWQAGAIVHAALREARSETGLSAG
jgi:cytochrome c oxidase cbb3-type subunit 1